MQENPLNGKLLFALLASAVLGAFFWTSPVLWPFKLLVVLMHESGHAAATLLVGGSVRQIQLASNEGGLTTSLYQPGLLRQVVISSAGYVGSTISGCVLLFTAARSQKARLPLVALALWCATVAVLWGRDAFTLAFTLSAAAVLALCARFAPAFVRRGLLVFVAAFSTCYALYDIRDDLLHLTSRGPSDAEALAQATYIPALVWGIGWGLLSVVLVIATLRLVATVRAPRRVSVAASGI